MMEKLFLLLFNTTVASSWLILAVILLRFMLTTLPSKYRKLLWLLVGIRLLLPAVPEFPLSLVPSTETVSPDMLYSDAPHITSGMAYVNTFVNPIMEESLAPAVGASVNPLQVISYLSAWLWLVGFSLILIYAVFTSVRLAFLLRGLKEDGGVCVTDKIDVPFIFGFPRPRIYLPDGLGESSLPHVLAHERAHIKSFDYIAKPLFFVVCAVHWFNPLVWVAYVLFSRDIELACDESVVGGMEHEGKRAYLSTLVELTSADGTKRKKLCSPLAFGEADIKERIKNVMKTKKGGIIAAAVMAVLAAALVIFLMTSPTGGVKNQKSYLPDGLVLLPSEVLFEEGTVPLNYSEQNHPYFMILEGRAYYANQMRVDFFYRNFDGGRVGVDTDTSGWIDVGELKEIELDKENFDGRFESAQKSGFSAANLRKSVKSAWQAISVPYDGGEGENLIFLLLENGERYICYGKVPSRGVPMINRVFKTAELITSSCVYMSPLSSFMETRKGYIYEYSVRKGEKGDEIVVTEIESGRVVASGPVSPWKKMSEKEWNALFTLSFGHPQYNKERHDYIMLEGGDYLLRIGDKTMYGSYGGKKSGMWSIYILKEPDGDEAMPLGAEDTENNG